MNTQALQTPSKRTQIPTVSTPSVKVVKQSETKDCEKSNARNKKAFDFVGLAG